MSSKLGQLGCSCSRLHKVATRPSSRRLFSRPSPITTSQVIACLCVDCPPIDLYDSTTAAAFVLVGSDGGSGGGSSGGGGGGGGSVGGGGEAVVVVVVLVVAVVAVVVVVTLCAS